MFCKHDWKEIERTYASPMNNGGSLSRCSEKLAERLLFGVTTILWECQKCQDIRTEEMLGVSNGQRPVV